MRDLVFLWSDGEGWAASVPYGPTGRGGSREAALADLRSVLRARHREINRRSSGPRDPMVEKLLGPDWERSSAEAERRWIEEIDSLDLDRCLFISPGAFEALLAGQCSRRKSGRGFTGEPLRPLTSVHVSGRDGFFRRHRILVVGSELYGLECPSGWTPESYGLFAFDGSRLLALNRRPENLAALLRSEARPLDEADPQQIASFFAEAVGCDGRLDHQLVTRESLEAHDATHEFALDRDELTRITPLLRAPAIQTRAEGWRLEFSTLFGWSEEKQTVLGWEVEVSRRFALEVRTRTLSKRIFHSTPIVME